MDATDLIASIVDSSDDAILSKDLEGTILSWNKGAERIYGYKAAEVIGKNVSILVAPEMKDEIPAIMARLRKGLRINHYETLRMTKDGTILNISVTVSPIKDPNGKVIAASAVARDITARKRYEQEMARIMQELRMSLSHKNILLQEVYHRVKNNLQIVSSLLDLRSKYLASDPEKVRSAFQESIERIRAMALVHEKLYSTHTLEQLNFSEYLQTLIEQLFRTYSVDRKIDLKITGDPVELDLNTAIPLGLIFNELLTNSLKHAFTNSRDGHIAIHCAIKGNQVTLKYCDDGDGLGADTDFSTSQTFGFRIIRLLVKQIRGTIHISNDHGAAFEIVLPRKTEIKNEASNQSASN